MLLYKISHGYYHELWRRECLTLYITVQNDCVKSKGFPPHNPVDSHTLGMDDTSTKILIPILYVLNTTALSTFCKNRNFNFWDHMIFYCKKKHT